MDVTGTDPRARTGLFLWPWATTGYSNMNSSNASGTNIQATPPLGLSSPSTGSFEQGIQMQHQQQNQSQHQDSSLESFYSRLPYSAGGAVPSLQQMQQHQRQQREAAVAAAQAISEMQGQQQQGLQQSSRMGPISSQASQSQSQIPTQAPPPPPQFDQRSGQLMNGRQAQATINSASSSPLNNSAYHNPSLSPNSQNQHPPHQQTQQQQQQQQQFQRHYSSAGSLQNVTGASPLDGRISSSASPSGSSAAPSYSLKRSSNDFNSATAMALALQAVAKGDRQMPPPPPSLSMHNSTASNQPVDHLQGGDMFSMNSTNYLFQPPNMSKGPGGSSGGGIHSRSSSEAAAQMAAAMVANEMGMDPRSAGSAHPLSGLHAAGGFLPDFLSSSSAAMGDTKMDPSGGVGLRGPFDGPPTMPGGLGMMEGLPGIYGHAAKGYKCKICQHVCFSRQDLSTHNSTTHKQDPRPYRCDQCGRQFSTCAYLSQHRRIHSGIKPYVCRYCDRKFTQLSHVQQHERIHTGEKPYKCATCFKSFTQMSNLQSHQRQHMKGKPHRCENCFMSYDTKEELDVHVQAKHSGNRYAKVLVCPACSKSYNSETYLAKHMERHKEAVTNANVNRFGALNTSAGALGALSGFMTSHHSGMGSRSIAPVTEQSLHEELQQRIGHPQDLQNLQRAAVAAAASIISPMGPPGLGGHDTNHLLHHLPSGLQGQLSMAQKSHQQGVHGSGNHPGGHNTSGFVDSYQQHQMLAAASPYSNQMPSFLGRSSDVRQMPRFPPTPLDATGRKMMDFQGNQPMPPQPQALNPPMAHQQMSMEHSAPPQTPSMQPPPPPPQFQSPQTLPHQQSQSMRPFVNSPQDARRGKNMEGGNGKHVGDDGKEANSWDQGPVIPIPIMDNQDNGSSVSITGDEPGGNLWTPHSAAKRLKPDPDERYSHHHHHHQTQQQPFETEYLRRSAAAEPQYQQQMIQSQMQASENSMEHVVDKLAKFWQRNSTGQTMDGKPGRDIRIEALLSGFPQNSERDRRSEEMEQDNESGEMERLCNMSQSSSNTNRKRDYQPEVQSPRPSREENESGYRGNSEEDRENNGARNDGTATPGYHHTAYGSSVANEGRNNSETGYSNTGTFYGTDATARDLSVIRDDDGVQQQADSTGNGVGFPVHFSSQSAQ